MILLFESENDRVSGCSDHRGGVECKHAGTTYNDFMLSTEAELLLQTLS